MVHFSDRLSSWFFCSRCSISQSLPIIWNSLAPDMVDSHLDFLCPLFRHLFLLHLCLPQHYSPCKPLRNIDVLLLRPSLHPPRRIRLRPHLPFAAVRRHRHRCIVCRRCRCHCILLYTHKMLQYSPPADPVGCCSCLSFHTIIID